MQGFGGVATATLLGVVVFAGADMAHAQQDPDAESRTWVEHADDIGGVAYDLAVLRPVGLVRLLAGSVTMVPVGVFSWPGGLDALSRAADLFVLLPFEDTVVRELGDF